MNPNPLISIIIPVYNVEDYIRPCLDSILAQTYTNFEAILVDDGSKDGSGRICDEYAEKDSRFIVVHKENGGVSSARNKGLEIAKGEYIAFVDSDDWIENNYLTIILNEIEDYDLLFFGNIAHYNDGNIVYRLPPSFIGTNKEETEKGLFQLRINDIHFGFFGYTCFKVFKREIINSNHLDFIKGLCIREDEIFTGTYCRYAKTLKVISQPLYHYRILSTPSNRKKFTKCELQIYTKAIMEQSSNWTNEYMKRYDLLLYASFYLDLAHQQKNPFKCISMSSKAYNIKKQVYDDIFVYHNKGAIKRNKFVGVIINLIKCLLRR